MTAANTQIVTSYEDHDLTPEQIAKDQELDLDAVKATLMQFSAKYRREAKVDDQLNFSEQGLVAANQVIEQIMQYSEDDNLRLRAAMYIRNDKKGRLDATQMRGLNISVIQFNERLIKARQSVQEAVNKVITLDDKDTKLLEAANQKFV
jgi:hypothetical protein